MELTVIIFALGLLVMGTVWTLIGFHGRVIDDHPLCRKCGFDLFGKPADHDRCSECGSELHSPGSIVIGHREKRWGKLKLGVLLLLCGLFPLSLIVIAAFGHVNVEHFKPSWFLLLDASHSSPGKSSVALKELDGRLIAGLLQKDQIDSICDRGIAIQGDLSKPWNPDWGSFIEDANSAGKLDNSRWTTFAKQAPQNQIRLRSKVTSGDDLPFLVGLTGRVGRGAGRMNGLWVQYSNLTLSSGPFSKTIPLIGGSSIASQGGGSQMSFIHAKDLKSFSPGVFSMKVSIVSFVSRGQLPGNPAIAQLTTNLSTTVEILPHDEKSVRFKHDPNLRDAVIKSLTGNSRWPYREYNLAGPVKTLTFQLTGFDVPVGLAYRMIARKGTQKWDLGMVTFEKGARNTWNISADSPDFAQHPNPLDIVLTPDLDAAANTIDIDEIWDEEVILKNIEIGWPGKPQH